MAASQIGAVHTPIYPTLVIEDFEYILKHSEAVMLIVSDKLLFNKLSPIVSKNKKIKFFYSFNELNGVENFSSIVSLGESNYEKRIDEVEKIKSEITSDDLHTLIYTSGTIV